MRLNDRHAITGDALNIAETGIEIEFAAREVAPLSVGTLVGIELCFRDEIVHLTGEVRRHQGTHCALMFAEPTSDQSQHKAARLHGMVMSLQQFWLKNRLR
ncbi:MAG: hypothetical protein AABP62_04430 [Planctomycetota bacterium]